jgi:hypothetical protein
MEKNINTLIVPDVHGRWFWKEPVEKVLSETNAHIVFLGDYLDPYPYEWEDCDMDYHFIAIDRFKNIIELKKANPDRITLLLGNHDCGYCIGDDICSCRMDYANRREIEELFQENRELFQIALEKDINGKHFIFSHAGMLKDFFTSYIKDVDWDKVNPVDWLNNAWLTEDFKALDYLGYYDHFRGYFGAKYGSPIWSDLRAWENVKKDETFGFNIVGHTQLETDPIWFEAIIDLDCRRAFYLDNDGRIINFDDDSVVKE